MRFHYVAAAVVLAPFVEAHGRGHELPADEISQATIDRDAARIADRIGRAGAALRGEPSDAASAERGDDWTPVTDALVRQNSGYSAESSYRHHLQVIVDLDRDG